MAKKGRKPMQTASRIETVKVANPLAVRRAAYEDVRHNRGVTTYKPAPESTVKVERSKTDVVDHMYDRRQISEEAFRAAREFQKTHEAADASIRSSGDIREFVDGGLGPQIPISDARQRAAKSIGEWRQLLGEVGYSFVVSVCVGLPGRGPMTIREYADQANLMPSKAATTFYGHLFRSHLARLAKAMGYA